MGYENPQQREYRPTFNVCLPFQRVTMVQMNLAMRDLLHDFFSELCDDETEEEVVAFGDALEDPAIYVHASRFDEPSFIVCEKYMGVVVIEMNNPMRDLIRKFISDVEGVEREIMAFSKALADPEASREIRDNKMRWRRENRQEEQEQQGKVRRRKLTTA
jgi:hypothetical protein